MTNVYWSIDLKVNLKYRGRRIIHEKLCLEIIRMQQNEIEILKETLNLTEDIIFQHRIHISKLEARNEDWYADLFHPEFGSEWGDDGECTKAYTQGYIAAMEQREVVKRQLPNIEVHDIHKQEVPCTDHPLAPHGFDRAVDLARGVREEIIDE